MINRIFRSEAAFLDLKQDLENRIFRLETGFFFGNIVFNFENKTFGLETRLFRLETKFSEYKRDF